MHITATALFLILLHPILKTAQASTVINSEWGKIVGQCKSTTTTKRHVWIFKQWHLAPSASTVTKTDFSTTPQEKNQTAIYEQLNTWIQAGTINTIYAEGCQGEINTDYKTAFNGWTLDSLKKAAKKSFYAQIVTSVPLKLEAQHGANLLTLCGDDDVLVKKNDLAFSDARGAAGFLSRLTQYKNDPSRAKTYLSGVVEIYKMPANTSIEAAIAKLTSELKASVGRITELLNKRNKQLLKIILSHQDSASAVVYGGTHAAGMLNLLEQAGLGCTIIEPTGYTDNEEQLLHDLSLYTR